MKAKELIKILEKDPEREIIMSSDGEGNNYSPLYDCGKASYRQETSWSGGIGIEELTEELIKKGYRKEDVIEDGIRAWILYPIN